MSAAARPVDSFIRGVEVLSRVCGAVSVLCLSAASIVVCQMVFVRYTLGNTTIWQTEFVTFAVVAATLIGSPYVLLRRAHVTVDLLPHYLAERPRRWLALTAALFAWLACATLAWTGGAYFYEAWTEGWATESVWGPPLWIPLLSLPIGLGILTLQYTADIICLVTGRSLARGPSGTQDSS